MIGQEDIRAAHARISRHVRRTPVLCTGADDFGLTLRQPVTFKLEFLQHTGTFKPRGAFNNLLSRAVPAGGVAAASGGNHGAAVAYAAQQLGHKATIFVPDVSSPVKIARIKNYGADARVGGARYADALERCEAFVAQSGALSVHAYDAPETVAGQGSDAGPPAAVEPRCDVAVEQDIRARRVLGPDSNCFVRRVVSHGDVRPRHALAGPEIDRVVP